MSKGRKKGKEDRKEGRNKGKIKPRIIRKDGINKKRTRRNERKK